MITLYHLNLLCGLGAQMRHGLKTYVDTILTQVLANGVENFLQGHVSIFHHVLNSAESPVGHSPAGSSVFHGLVTMVAMTLSGPFR